MEKAGRGGRQAGVLSLGVSPVSRAAFAQRNQDFAISSSANRQLFAAPALLAEPHLFGKPGTRGRIVRRHHWVVRG